MLLGKTRKLWHQLLCKFWPLLLLLTSLYLHAILRYFPFVFCSFLCMWAYYPPIGENVIFISWFLTFIDLEEKVKNKIKQNLKALIPVFAFVLTTNAKNWGESIFPILRFRFLLLNILGFYVFRCSATRESTHM